MVPLFLLSDYLLVQTYAGQQGQTIVVLLQMHRVFHPLLPLKDFFAKKEGAVSDLRQQDSWHNLLKKKKGCSCERPLHLAIHPILKALRHLLPDHFVLQTYTSKAAYPPVFLRIFENKKAG